MTAPQRVVYAAPSAEGDTPDHTLSVAGSGKVTVVPDMATINLGVLIQREKAKAAREATEGDRLLSHLDEALERHVGPLAGPVDAEVAQTHSRHAEALPVLRRHALDGRLGACIGRARIR